MSEIQNFTDIIKHNSKDNQDFEMYFETNKQKEAQSQIIGNQQKRAQKLFQLKKKQDQLNLEITNDQIKDELKVKILTQNSSPGSNSTTGSQKTIKIKKEEKFSLTE